MTVVMTCSYPDSGLSGLVPAGVVVGVWSRREGPNGHDKVGARKSAAEELKIAIAGAGFTHAFNVRFTEECDGHPSYMEHKAYAVGDAYVPSTTQPRPAAPGPFTYLVLMLREALQYAFWGAVLVLLLRSWK